MNEQLSVYGLDQWIRNGAHVGRIVPHGPANFAALVTAQNPEAPPMLQWDRLEKRNTVSHYLYVNGSMPRTWNLVPGSWTTATAIALGPSQWDASNPMPHQGQRVFFILDGAKDMMHLMSGGLFVENIRSEYHSIRATLEAYFQSAAIAGRDEATACGLLCVNGSASTWGATMRVTDRMTGAMTTYKLDRWD